MQGLHGMMTEIMFQLLGLFQGCLQGELFGLQGCPRVLFRADFLEKAVQKIKILPEGIRPLLIMAEEALQKLDALLLDRSRSGPQSNQYMQGLSLGGRGLNAFFEPRGTVFVDFQAPDEYCGSFRSQRQRQFLLPEHEADTRFFKPDMGDDSLPVFREIALLLQEWFQLYPLPGFREKEVFQDFFGLGPGGLLKAVVQTLQISNPERRFQVVQARPGQGPVATEDFQNVAGKFATPDVLFRVQYRC